MAKRRVVNTRFWSDGFVANLEPLDRYLFLYFLTNEHTDISGIYEVPMRTVAFETGLSSEKIDGIMKRLGGKIHYVDGWVYVRNFAKHQADNESVRRGISRSMGEIPAEILAKIKEVEESVGQTGGRLGTESPHAVIPNLTLPNSTLPNPKGGAGGLDYLRNVPHSDVEEFMSRFQITEKQVKSVAEDLKLYCERKGKTYKNYKAFLLNAIKRDYKEKVEVAGGKYSKL